MPIVAPNQMRAYQLYYQQAAQKLNLVNTVMLESTQSAYQQAVAGVVAEIDLADRLARTQKYLDIAAGETITGVSSWNAAMAHAMERLTTGGITGFIDHAGRRWSAEAYVAMDIRTTVFNTGRAAVWETNQNFGNDLYVVSYHNGARPLCYPWQNKVVSATDNARTVKDLDGNEIEVIAQSATSYGQAAGLFGINCKHHPDPFIPGVSVIHGEPQDKELNDRVYAESQEQRGLERKIREQKRDLMIMKEQGYPDDAIKAQRAKIRATDDEIDAFCDRTGRARRQNREGVYTKRDFPDADKYDVAAFERKQKDLINSFYQNGGEQQNYTLVGMASANEYTPTPQVQIAVGQSIPTAIEKSEIEKIAESYGIPRMKVDRLQNELTESEIISRIGGGDKTAGSCASVGYAYIGNKSGLDVHDFRGGLSQWFFASPGTAKMIAELDGVNGTVIDNGYMFTNAHKLLKKVEKGKEYFFTAGRHAAIVRKTNNVLEYLELQTQNDNGWHELNDSVLNSRFGCIKQEQKPYDVLIDAEKLKDNLTFKKLLEFINTAEGSQMKGVGGYAK